MQNVKKEELERLAGYIASYKKTLESLRELREALNKYDKKIIDKRFFEEFFTVSNEYRNYTKYSITAPVYSWSKHSHELYIDQNTRLELNGRERQHILAVIEAEGAKRENWIASNEQELAKLETLDEPAIIADLLAVYEKHGKPEQWTKILDIYEVKYPKDDK